MNNEIFCKGVLCRRNDRKNRCHNCNRWVCGTCSISENKNIFCIDCFIKSFGDFSKFDKHIDSVFNKQYDINKSEININKHINEG